MTEEQAKKKWCPMAHAYCGDGSAAATINRAENLYIAPGDTTDKATRCIASDCMAWRRHVARDGRYREGYCGAFGKPEAI